MPCATKITGQQGEFTSIATINKEAKGSLSEEAPSVATLNKEDKDSLSASKSHVSDSGSGSLPLPHSVNATAVQQR